MPDYQFIVDFITTFDAKGIDGLVEASDEAFKKLSKMKMLLRRAKEFQQINKSLEGTGYIFNEVGDIVKETTGKVVHNIDTLAALSEALDKQKEATRKATRVNRRFRMELLGIMFAGQRIAKYFGDMIDPAREMVGIAEMEAMLRAEQTLPLMEEEIENLERQWDEWEGLTEQQKRARAEAIKLGESVGDSMDTWAAAGLLIFSAWDFVKGIPKDFDTAVDAIKLAFDGLKTSVLGMGWKDVGLAIAGSIILGFTGFFAGEALKKWAEDNFGPAGVHAAKTWLAAGALAFGLAAIAIAPFNLLAAAIVGAAAIGLAASAATLAEGGIVTRPTMALIGEAGPEAVIPLSKIGGMSNITISMNVYTTSSLSKEEIPALTREIAERLGTELREIRMGKVL